MPQAGVSYRLNQQRPPPSIPDVEVWAYLGCFAILSVFGLGLVLGLVSGLLSGGVLGVGVTEWAHETWECRDQEAYYPYPPTGVAWRCRQSTLEIERVDAGGFVVKCLCPIEVEL